MFVTIFISEKISELPSFRSVDLREEHSAKLDGAQAGLCASCSMDSDPSNLPRGWALCAWALQGCETLTVVFAVAQVVTGAAAAPPSSIPFSMESPRGHSLARLEN